MTIKVFIAEKPSVAKAIINELGSVKKLNGAVLCKNNIYVTWCFGHLLEQAEPDAYLPEDIPVGKKGNKIWRVQDLPIFPQKWILQPKKDKGVKAQLKVIKDLLTKADIVVNAGDPDREGQLLVDEILEHFKYKKTVQRFLVSAQDSASIRKSLTKIEPNSKYEGMKLAALGRSRADWLLGMNLTRALTLKKALSGERTLIAVGRVQTPTLSLVAKRDQDIRNFKPIPFFTIKCTVSNGSTDFSASWIPKNGQSGLDEERRLTDGTVAKSLVSRLQNQKTAKVLSFSKEIKQKTQPKVFSLADIQLEASSKYGFSAQETLDTCQSLYETHKLASYPRSDCQYLPESQWEESKTVLTAIAKTLPKFLPLIRQCNLQIKSSVWNDKKISAHHAIIPTGQAGSLEKLSDKEQKIYELLCLRYICQFYPPYKFYSTNVSLAVENETFIAKGTTTISPGWKAVIAQEKNEKEEEIPLLQEGQQLTLKDVKLQQEKTKAPPAFTEGTLIAAMENIHNAVEDPKDKKLLKDGDGIGTPATRAAIITELKRKGYLETKGKQIHATALGQQLLTVVPPLIKNPALTARFERVLKQVENKEVLLEQFLEIQKKFIRQEIASLFKKE